MTVWPDFRIAQHRPKRDSTTSDSLSIHKSKIILFLNRCFKELPSLKTLWNFSESAFCYATNRLYAAFQIFLLQEFSKFVSVAKTFPFPKQYVQHVFFIVYLQGKTFYLIKTKKQKFSDDNIKSNTEWCRMFINFLQIDNSF